MTRTQTQLVIATRNKGKIREMRHGLKKLPLQIKSLLDKFPIGEMDETGKTFSENALIKARSVHVVTGSFVLADDSGLECADLNGAPGIFSARFAGPKATDEENNQKLLEAIKAVHDPCRIIRYVCAMVLIDPLGHEEVIEETCEGVMTMKPGGLGGFGYDPYFFIPEKKCTMAELPLDERNKISHRGKALEKILKILTKCLL